MQSIQSSSWAMALRFPRAFVAGLSAMALSTGPASAAETIKLTAISGFPPVASWVKVFKEYFMAGVDSRLG